jgi:hypothetical protein
LEKQLKIKKNGNTTDNFMTESQTIKFQKEISFNKLKGSVFRHYGGYDSSGLCDGGDYLYNIQIRVENEQGDVYVSIQPRERSEWWSGTMTWEEFHDMILYSIKRHPKMKYHEH